MSMDHDPFADLIPKQQKNVADEDLIETEKYRKRGEKVAKNSSITPYLNPLEGRQEPSIQGEDPFADLIPNNSANAPIAPSGAPNAPISPEDEKSRIDMSKSPWLLKKALEFVPSMKRPLGQQFSENMANVGRGLTEIGQGAKQAGIGAGEYLGVIPYGTQAKYTEGTEAERKAFEETSAGKDPYGKALRSNVQQAPFMAAASLPILGEAGALMKVLLGGVGGGTAKGLEYRQPGEDRPTEILKGGAEGALMNLIPEIPGLVGSAVSKTKSAINAGKEVTSLQEATEKAKAAHEAALAEHETAKMTAKQSPLKRSDADKMLSDLDANQQKIETIDKELASQQEGIADPAQYFVDTPKEAETRLAKAQKTHQAAKDALTDLKTQEKKIGEMAQPEVTKADEVLAKADQNMATHLNSGAEHNVKGAKIVSEDLETNRKAISKDFDKLEENTAKQKINLPPETTKTAEEINADLRRLVSENKADSKEASDLIAKLDKIGKQETIAANDYIATYRATNAYMRDAYKKGYQPGLNPELQRHWQGVGDQLKAQLQKMDSVLENGLKGEDYKLFKETANRWRKEVVPLYRNPVYRKMKGGKGKLPKDTMEALAGDEEGNVLIRNAIQKNPEALKHVVGQRYDTKAGRELVHNPNEQVGGYTSLMPDLQKLVGERQAAKSGQEAVAQKYEAQKQAIKKAQEETQALEARAKNHVQMQKESKAKSDQMRKEHETKLENIKNLKQQRESLEETNKLLDEHIKQLKKTAANKNLTKQEHAKAAERLQRAEQKKASIDKKIEFIKYGIVAGAAGYGGVKSAKTMSAINSLPGEE